MKSQRAFHLLAWACSFLATDASAAMKETNAAQVCGYLNSVGLQTQSWKNYGDGEYGCNSDYKKLGSENLANNIAYYVDGDAKRTVTKAYLVLNVNSRSTATVGHQELLNDASLLISRVTGGVISPEIKNAILGGKPGRFRIGQAGVTVSRTDWPTGRGYEIHVEVE